ncbi:enoyl-CoA hydratase/isomerase family protein [Sphingorhabdus sp.]|jgi:enoyl-CoA hydratase/carnithine racemase|uniref:enoyl-CoA hydratase/isomerase family protein n=1 Tax=Sphingorhabdus sp. TaxID=1902408 RepID=UPI0037C6D771
MSHLNTNISARQHEGILADVADGVLTVTLDREDKRNAITYDMYLAIVHLLEQARSDRRVRCILFRAQGSIFTAGHDVSGFAKGVDMAFDQKPSYKFMQSLSTCPKPVVAMLNGDAVGIGATMLLHCDLVYAVPGARLVFPFTKMGLVPEFGSTYHLPLRIGHQKAMELFLRQGLCSTKEAAAWGIVNEVVPRQRIHAVVADALADIVALSPEAVTQTKALAKAAFSSANEIAIATEAQVFHELLRSDFVRHRIASIQRSISRS